MSAKKNVDYGQIVTKSKQAMERQTAGKPAVAAPSEAEKEPVKKTAPKTGAQKGLPDGWTRFTVTVPIDLAEQMKDLAYTERKKLKDVVVSAFEEALKGKELIHRPDSAK